MISSIPSIRTIIPLSPAGIEAEGDEIFKLTTKDGQVTPSPYPNTTYPYPYPYPYPTPTPYPHPHPHPHPHP